MSTVDECLSESDASRTRGIFGDVPGWARKVITEYQNPTHLEGLGGAIGRKTNCAGTDAANTYIGKRKAECSVANEAEEVRECQSDVMNHPRHNQHPLLSVFSSVSFTPSIDQSDNTANLLLEPIHSFNLVVQTVWYASSSDC